MDRLSSKIVTVIISTLLLIPAVSFSQSGRLTLTTCYEMAEKNYPLIKSRELITQSGSYTVKNVNSGLFPSISINGQYTNQSDVTALPVELPNVAIPEIDHNQYKIYAEINQVIYDGGATKNRRQGAEVQTRIEQESLEVELYKLKERINQIYFGILLVERQINQAGLLKKDLISGLEKTEAAYHNGITLKSSVDAMKAELLKLDQRIIELKATRNAYINMLSLFINLPLDDNTEFEMPSVLALSSVIKRPEMNLFEAQLDAINIQSKSITAKNNPKINLFLQGGYGSPALNMLNPDADTYYIGGVRLNFPISGFYNKHREKLINSISHSNIEIKRETYLFNTNIQLAQQNSELQKIHQLISTDDEIVTLRESIKLSSLAQLQNGVITSADYLREVNAADNARQMKIIHEIQLLLTQYNYQLITGN